MEVVRIGRGVDPFACSKRSIEAGRATWDPDAGTVTFGRGMVTLTLNATDGDYHVDVLPGARRAMLDAALCIAGKLGLQVLDDKWSEPVVTERGAVRHWLAPIEWDMREVMCDNDSDDNDVRGAA